MITIVTPNLNDGAYIEDNILSIKKLRIPFEHIVVDGGSTDNSLSIIEKYPHVRLIRQEKRNGMYGAIDLGFKAANGDYFAWINSDDRVVVDGYEKMYQVAKDKKISFIYSDSYYYYVGKNNYIISKGRRFGKLFLKNGIMPALQPSILFSKQLYNNIGGFKFENFLICGDLDLFLRMSKNSGYRSMYLPVVSSIFTKRGDSLGDLNHERYLYEIRSNNLPKPSLLARLVFHLCKYI